MIEEPPLLSIKRPNRRPTAAQIAAFEGAPTSFVVDAMQGGHVLERQIRPLWTGPGVSVAGPALTADNAPGDILALLAALKFARPGDVILSAAQGYQGCAAMGDRVAGFAKNAGAIAVVTDGPARDYDGISAVGLPVWCTGLCPDTPQGTGPGKVGLPILLGGQRVASGDIVVADYDGVVIVPFNQIDTVIAKLEIVKDLEAALDAELQNGLSLPPSIDTLLSSDQVNYIQD